MDIETELDAARDWFKDALKEAYGFVNYGEYGGGYDSQQNYAPYTNAQHHQFLYKFNHFHTEQLGHIDADLQTLKDYVTNKIAERTNDADVQSSELQGNILSKVLELQDRLRGSADTKLATLDEEIDIALEELMEEREVRVELAESRTAELRKKIIYAVHVLRYAGGK
jgi:ElaB/YqjD/DUF883 family membrane-anchored ribosome-binding protein